MPTARLPHAEKGWILRVIIGEAAQPHRGQRQRFLAQPHLDMAESYDIEGGTSPAERAIRRALGQ